jgi:ornithine lipid ester-linked acyl 2-hydroxylase
MTTQHIWPEDEFKWLKPISERWESIRDYSLTVPFIPYRETNIYNKGWLTYGLRYKTINWNRSDDFMDPILTLLPFEPFIVSFSCLEPGVEVNPHRGFTDDVIRFHLGLICPQEDIAIKLDGVEYNWQEGKWLIFNDRVLHSVWNRGSQNRYVLLMDFYKSDIGLD